MKLEVLKNFFKKLSDSINFKILIKYWENIDQNIDQNIDHSTWYY